MIPSGARVLDLGASRGALGRALSPRGCTVDGVELDASSAERARSDYRRVLTLDLDQADLAIELAGSEYDVVVCADVLEHLRDPERLLRSLPGLLARQGQLLVSVPNVAYVGVVLELILGRFDYRQRGLLDETHLRFFTRDSIVDLLNRSGFGVGHLEALHLDLEASEFDADLLAHLPNALLRALEQRPDGLAYQFLLSASPGLENAPDVRSSSAAAELRFCFLTQLYWRAPEEAFTEERSGLISLPIGGGTHQCEFQLPAGLLAGFRWDPLDRPGLIRIEQLELLTSDATVLWKGDHRTLKDSASHSTDVRWLGPPSSLSLLSIGRDPWIETSFDEPLALSAGARVRIQFNISPLEEGMRVTEALVQAEQRTADALSRSEDALRRLSTAALEQAVQSDASERRQLKRSWQAVEKELRGVTRAITQLSTHLEASRELQLAQFRRVEALEHALVENRLQARVRRLLRRGVGELYRLRREFGRRQYDFEVRPALQVEITASGGFQSTGNDPQLELVPTEGKYPYGLVVLRYELDSDVDEASLFFDVGSGYRPSGRVFLRRGAQGITVALPPNVRGLRFDPRESPGPFKLSHVTFTEISAPELVGQRVSEFLRSVSEEPSRTPELLGSALRKLRTGLPSAAFLETVPIVLPEDRTAYREWIKRHGTFTDEDRRRASKAIQTWIRRPKVSVVMPVFNVPGELLTRAIESVRAQVYENWELCIVDDASTDSSVEKVLAAAADGDRRIRVKRRAQNGHIVQATNSALEEVSGEFVVFLDHDDELAPEALALVVEALNRWPETELLYSDEDKLDATGERFDPAFKPDWSPELLLAQNYVNHLMAIRTDLIRRVGGMRAGLEGSQDQDLVLRLSEIVPAERIRHLPFVLYHWRAASGSTASVEGGAKPYAGGAGLRAVREFLERRGRHGEVTPGRAPYSYQVRYALPEPVPRVSIIIPTRDGLDLLRSCISTVQEQTLYRDYEIIVVDNDSAHPATLEYLAELERSMQARVLRYQKPFNFSAINNFAAEHATGSVLVLLNNDIEVIAPDWLREMVSLAVQPDVGAVGAMLLYPDGVIQHAGVVAGMGGVAGHLYKREPGSSWGRSRELTVRREVSAVTAACLAVEREKFQRVGGLDAEHLRVAFNDVDFCLKLREAGFRNLWTPHAVLRHHESVSRGSDERPERQAAFQGEIAFMKKKWGRVLKHDPFFSPNYSFDYEIPQLAFPPRVTPFYREGAP